MSDETEVEGRVPAATPSSLKALWRELREQRTTLDTILDLLRTPLRPGAPPGLVENQAAQGRDIEAVKARVAKIEDDRAAEKRAADEARSKADEKRGDRAWAATWDLIKLFAASAGGAVAALFATKGAPH